MWYHQNKQFITNQFTKAKPLCTAGHSMVFACPQLRVATKLCLLKVLCDSVYGCTLQATIWAVALQLARARAARKLQVQLRNIWETTGVLLQCKFCLAVAILY